MVGTVDGSEEGSDSHIKGSHGEKHQVADLRIYFSKFLEGSTMGTVEDECRLCRIGGEDSNKGK